MLRLETPEEAAIDRSWLTSTDDFGVASTSTVTKAMKATTANVERVLEIMIDSTASSRLNKKKEQLKVHSQ